MQIELKRNHPATQHSAALGAVHDLPLKRMAALLFFLICCAIAFSTRAAGQTPNSCLDCHAKLTTQYRVTAQEVAGDSHFQKGVTCVNCHGGDPASADKDRSMSPAAGYRGHIDRKQVPALCAKCHSDAAYMRDFNPSLRTDQLSQYETSVHGKQLAKGDTKVAVCTDCHGVHDVLSPHDPRSKVYPVNVAQTCAHCHADAEYMKPYNMPTNQFADYQGSVHYTALTTGGDLSAPTCSTCHGSHGAAPPGVQSVAMVCSTCHVFQAQLFYSGPHKDAFASFHLPGCVTCHTNHRILHPTDAFIGTAPDSVCMKCHLEGDRGYGPAAKMHEQLTSLASAIDRSNNLLSRAESAGAEVGEAKLALAEARDNLTKARVEIHAVKPELLDPDIDAGLKITAKTWAAGESAMAELRYRRRGLVISLATIILALIGLFLMIRKLESKPSEKRGGKS